MGVYCDSRRAISQRFLIDFDLPVDLRLYLAVQAFVDDLGGVSVAGRVIHGLAERAAQQRQRGGHEDGR